MIIGAEATTFYPGANTAVNIFPASIWVAHVPSHGGDSESSFASRGAADTLNPKSGCRKVRFGGTPLRLRSGQASPAAETYALPNYLTAWPGAAPAWVAPLVLREVWH